MKERRTGKLVLLSLSVIIIAIGFWFSGTNAYKFMKGYWLFKTGEPQTEVVLANKPDRTADKDKETQDSPSSLYSERPEKGEMIGNLTIPKLNANLPIYHGTDEDELEKGVGHFAGSVLPGEKDNSVLSGHRDTVFRQLGKVGKGDLLVVSTEAGEFTYKVRKVRIVDADDRTVIVPKPRATLTITTCYPFDFIGDAPERYILVADLIEGK
ncbi:class D sortase [Mesobacillus subterraneus]|uniref:class D sortase n=1 Tax=Mesobacillus subterraneus TaxID=285983 RepID=UPI002040A535|nr:class D sortase [Mesobacillus subterraneus]MCM3576471.1 class D sortase [Mesobacillus subterraneus]